MDLEAGVVSVSDGWRAWFSCRCNYGILVSNRQGFSHLATLGAEARNQKEIRWRGLTQIAMKWAS